MQDRVADILSPVIPMIQVIQVKPTNTGSTAKTEKMPPLQIKGVISMTISFLVLGLLGGLISTPIVVGAGLVVAIIIFGVAFMLFRGSKKGGKKDAAKAGTSGTQGS